MRLLLGLAFALACSCDEEPSVVDRWRANASQRPVSSRPTVDGSSAPSARPLVLDAPWPGLTELTTHDLGGVDERLRGLSIKAPRDVELTADLDGVRLRSIGADAFDLGVKAGPSDLLRFREKLLAGAVTTRSKVGLTEDERDRFAWTTTVGSLELFGLRQHLTTPSASVLCYTATERASRVELEAHRAACASLASPKAGNEK